MRATDRTGRGSGALALAWLLAAGCAAGDGPAGEAAVAASQREWTGHERGSTHVTMSDGTRIAVDWFLPTGYTGAGEAPTRFPVVFRYTPYGRSSVDARTGEVGPPGSAAAFLPYGYAVVAADFRGTGMSDGWTIRMDPRVRRDGGEVVDWIAAQSWSSGSVGMVGGSYEGWSQLAAASQKPAALKAIVPTHASFDHFNMRPGGIYSYAFIQTSAALVWHLNRATPFPGFPVMAATAPVVDEDGDGELLDEIPEDLDGDGLLHDDYGWPIEAGPAPRYADGAARERHAYLSAVMQHHADPAGAPGTYDYHETLRTMPFRDSKRIGDGATAAELDYAWLPDVLDSGVAILSVGGWFDPFVRSSVELFATAHARGSNPARLLVRPVYHQGVSPAFARYLGADTADVGGYGDVLFEETLRWFDRWLKGLENGVEREPPVKVFVAHAGWRESASWPPPGTAAQTWHLGPGQTLMAGPAPAGRDDHRVDLGHGSGWPPAFDTAPIAAVNRAIPRDPPVAAAFHRNRAFMFGVPEGPPVRTELDRRALAYTSPPLAQDTEVIGHPVVRVLASSTAEHGDLFFYLEDVAPDGSAVLVTDYQHRVGFDRPRDNDTLIPDNPGVDVEPELPFHGFARADYTDRPFADGRVVEVVTALHPTAWRFRAGHAIRLTIAGADWPTFELHPALAPTNDPSDPANVVPTITIHRGGDHPSRLELPVAPVAGTTVSAH